MISKVFRNPDINEDEIPQSILDMWEDERDFIVQSRIDTPPSEEELKLLKKQFIIQEIAKRTPRISQQQEALAERQKAERELEAALAGRGQEKSKAEEEEIARLEVKAGITKEKKKEKKKKKELEYERKIERIEREKEKAEEAVRKVEFMPKGFVKELGKLGALKHEIKKGKEREDKELKKAMGAGYTAHHREKKKVDFDIMKFLGPATFEDPEEKELRKKLGKKKIPPLEFK